MNNESKKKNSMVINATKFSGRHFSLLCIWTKSWCGSGDNFSDDALQETTLTGVDEEEMTTTTSESYLFEEMRMEKVMNEIN